MTIKNEILNGLLNNSKMTTSEIADYCGYEQNENKYGVVDRPLKQLVKDGLLIHGSLLNEKGRPASTYQIINDLEAILVIYDNFHELRDNIRNQDWIIDLIYSNNFIVEDSALREEICQMLKLSPTFFHISLTHPSINDLADRWITITQRDNIDLDLSENLTKNFVDTPYKFHKFFSFCIFLDDYNGINTDQSLNYLDNIVGQLKEKEQLVGNFSMSTIMMSLKKVCDIIENDNSDMINWLIFQITVYESKKQALEDLNAENKQDSETYYEMVNIYNEIFNKLNFEEG